MNTAANTRMANPDSKKEYDMNWSNVHFIEYLNAVDTALETDYGSASDMGELESISMAHQENTPPEKIAHRLRAPRK